jgi:c-di-GMP-binding flagellar brake protein YcgR
LVQSERPRARRYPFVASIEMTNVESEAQMNEQTCDLSLFGCGVNTQKPLPAGARVRIRIVHAGANFVTLGKVAHAGKSSRMGVVFTKIEPNQQLVLEKWIVELRGMQGAKQAKGR